MEVVGKSFNRVDALGKVTGEAKYTADLEPKDCLHAKVIHSTIANGLVKSFDLTEALKVPGVVKIVTCFDVPDYQFPTAGHPWSVEKAHQDIADRKLLNTRVRLYGDDIAAVVAENEVACQQAARLIQVEYEEYEPLVTVEQAMAPGATPLHPDLRKDNVIVHSHLTMGPKDFTFEEGLQEAKEKYGEENLVVLDKVYNAPPHFPLPHRTSGFLGLPGAKRQDYRHQLHPDSTHCAPGHFPGPGDSGGQGAGDQALHWRRVWK